MKRQLTTQQEDMNTMIHVSVGHIVSALPKTPRGDPRAGFGLNQGARNSKAPVRRGSKVSNAR